MRSRHRGGEFLASDTELLVRANWKVGSCCSCWLVGIHSSARETGAKPSASPRGDACRRGFEQQGTIQSALCDLLSPLVLTSTCMLAVQGGDSAQLARDNKAAHDPQGWRDAVPDHKRLCRAGHPGALLWSCTAVLHPVLVNLLRFCTLSSYVWSRVVQLLSHVAEQKLKHERMVQLQNQIMSENARLHGAIQIADENLERTGHISRDLEFANQMVRDENQR